MSLPPSLPSFHVTNHHLRELWLSTPFGRILFPECNSEEPCFPICNGRGHPNISKLHDEVQPTVQKSSSPFNNTFRKKGECQAGGRRLFTTALSEIQGDPSSFFFHYLVAVVRLERNIFNSKLEGKSVWIMKFHLLVKQVQQCEIFMWNINKYPNISPRFYLNHVSTEFRMVLIVKYVQLIKTLKSHCFLAQTNKLNKFSSQNS